MRELRGNFVYHQPTDEQIEQIQLVRGRCADLQKALEELPQNREISLAITKLEEVSMWANKGIVLGQGE